MAGDNTLQDASQRLQRALQRLEDVVDARLSREHVVVSAEEQVQRMTADRSRLAGELDTALARGQRLESANKEVSRRLVAAMETIRDVLDRHRS